MSVGERALGRALPALKTLPLVELGAFPTPVEPLDLQRVVPSFRGAAWVKREDRSSDVLGGNKVRKLEFLLGEAVARGCSSLVTMGGIGSNHCLVSAFYAPEAGLVPHLVVFPHAVTPQSRRTLAAIAALGPRVVPCPSATASPALAAAVHARLRLQGRRPYLVPPGGCSPTGTLGFVDAGLELAEQVAAGALDAPDAVFTAYGSGGSAAGLSIGLRLGGLSTEVVAVRVYDLPATSTLWVRSLARRTLRRICKLTDEPVADVEPAIRVTGDYLGPGYAEPTEAGSAAREAASELGLTLEPTYTAKTFAAFLDAAASPAYRDRRLLFVLTYDSRLPEGLLEGTDDELLPRSLRKYL